MPVLKTLVDPEIKSRFRKIAKALKLSESELLRAIVFDRTSAVNEVDQPIKPDPENAETDRMTVRMPRFLIKAIKDRAKKKGMAPSRWVAALAQSNITCKPVMSDDEIIKLRISNRELAAIGRNINQIARALNDTLQNSERLPLDKLAELGRVIAENRAAIRALVRASQNAWGVE
jgi:predicted DNA binding CopG/RHH family protein